MIRHYVFNLETTKIELHFVKSDYDALSDQQKAELKRTFLWSRKSQCWVSRAKEPNLYHTKQAAKKLGFSEERRVGERISYAEQIERQTERAEVRADRYDQYAAKAEQRGARLQKPIKDMRGDNAFFTQPIIAGYSGSQAFANRREKMFAKYDKGFEEYRKSDYFKGRAQTARETADGGKFRNLAYLDRRIKECKKTIRKRERNILDCEKILTALENGEVKKRLNGKVYTVPEVIGWIENELELIEAEMDKQAYLENCMDELGGIRFNKDNIKAGYIIRLDRGMEAEVIGTGPFNITYKILTGSAAGMTLTAAYAEISEIITAKEKREFHPFKVGEQFKAERRIYEDENSLRSTKQEIVYEIFKVSDTTINLKALGTDEKPIIRKPSKRFNDIWVFSIDDRYGNSFYKNAEAHPERHTSVLAAIEEDKAKPRQPSTKAKGKRVANDEL